MEIIIGKLIDAFYASSDGKFTLYKARASGGDYFTAVHSGEGAPKARRTVQIVMFGKWIKHPKYGKQFEIDRIEPFAPLNQMQAEDAKVRQAAAKVIGVTP